jgi:hypothetical protein
LSEIEARWSEIVGDGLAKLSQAKRFQSGSSGLTLVVKARGPAATLIEAQSAKIIERTARFSGKPIKRLKVVQGPLHEDLSVKRRSNSRILKVPRLDAREKNLDALMQDWAEAVARNENKTRKLRK